MTERSHVPKCVAKNISNQTSKRAMRQEPQLFAWCLCGSGCFGRSWSYQSENIYTILGSWVNKSMQIWKYLLIEDRSWQLYVLRIITAVIFWIMDFHPEVAISDQPQKRQGSNSKSSSSKFTVEEVRMSPRISVGSGQSNIDLSEK